MTAGPITAGPWRVTDGRNLLYVRGPTDVLTAVAGRTAALVTESEARRRATSRILTLEDRHRYLEEGE